MTSPKRKNKYILAAKDYISHKLYKEYFIYEM